MPWQFGPLDPSQGIIELAHDLRQPLSSIEAIAYYLEMPLDQPKTMRYLQTVQKLICAANALLDSTPDLRLQ
jgi:nitrogen-specific signal transduction histidine kinase